MVKKMTITLSRKLREALKKDVKIKEIKGLKVALGFPSLMLIELMAGISGRTSENPAFAGITFADNFRPSEYELSVFEERFAMASRINAVISFPKGETQFDVDIAFFPKKKKMPPLLAISMAFEFNGMAAFIGELQNIS